MRYLSKKLFKSGCIFGGLVTLIWNNQTEGSKNSCTSDSMEAAPSNIENIASDRPPFWEFFSGIISSINDEQFKKTLPKGPFFKNFLSNVQVSNSTLIVSLQRWVRLIGHWKVVELIFEMLKEGHIIPETLFQSYKTTNLSMHSR